MRIAVAGGTGAVGREIVQRARARGHDVSVIARSAGVDLRTGAGLDAALDGVEAVVDATNVATLRADESAEFFRTASSHLLAAADRAGVRHTLLLSIVGIDENPHGYNAGKVAQEAVYAASAAPWSLVRATQFHEFAGQIAGRARLGPVQLAPRARTQPIAAAAVADHLVGIIEGPPAGRTRDIAGPREERLERMIEAWVRRSGRRGPVVPVSLPGAQMRGMRAGLALPGPGAIRLGPTFDEWLGAVPRG
ncbi:SDR family oxidoreductase [Microbacterium sp. 179-B 1A2 NHS]|uniref:SDR family oxidoreductase n=1 Tax=Microbacterium sp. 179-B 1A2 NHS TaxID=3142383 RepID=UPI00399FED91